MSPYIIRYHLKMAGFHNKATYFWNGAARWCIARGDRHGDRSQKHIDAANAGIATLITTTTT